MQNRLQSHCIFRYPNPMLDYNYIHKELEKSGVTLHCSGLRITMHAMQKATLLTYIPNSVLSSATGHTLLFPKDKSATNKRVQMFEFFGDVTPMLASDNCITAVNHAKSHQLIHFLFRDSCIA